MTASETDPGRLRLGLFLRPFGHHVGASAVSDVTSHPTEVALFADYARRAETGQFEFVFLADSLLHSGYAKGDYPSFVEPITALSAIAALTTHIGLVGTISTSFDAPFHVARRLAALDHLSRGRAGWNIVTSRHDDEARNFGRDEHPGHGSRYARAAEHVEATLRLWASWDENAYDPGRPVGSRVDHAAIRPIDFLGDHLAVRGPLNIPRPPQGAPVLVQAGGSADGIGLGSRFADIVFTAQSDLAEAKRFRQRVRDAAYAAGRSQSPLVMPGLYVLLGSTEEEVGRRRGELGHFIDDAGEIARLARDYGTAIAPDSWDRAVEDVPELLTIGDNTSQWIQRAVIADAIRRGFTVRDLARDSAERASHLRVTGTPERVADAIIDLHRRGIADGFNIKPAVMDVDLAIFIDEVVPLLRRAGIRPGEYAGRDLRARLGLGEDPLQRAGRHGPAGTGGEP